jgi:hypothetical protein
MSAVIAWVDVIGKTIKVAGVVANIGRNQLIKKLDDIRKNLEQFKAAAEKDDASAMRQLLEECKALSGEFEQRLFKGLDDKTNRSIERAIGKARAAKSSLTRKREASPNRVVQAAAKEKGDELAGAMTDGESSRQQLILDMDTAIGRLRGISKSLESSRL